jgi:hypothetical protein
MRYLVLLKGVPTTEPPPAALMKAIADLGLEATRSGALLDTAGLMPRAAGARLTVSGGQLDVTDGPFTEAKELVSYALWDVHGPEDAVEWTRRFLAAHQQHWPGWEGEADVIKVMGPEDFAQQG